MHRKKIGNAVHAKLGANHTSATHDVSTGHTHGCHAPPRRDSTTITAYSPASTTIRPATTSHRPLTP